jgi:hypothetical protein
MIHDFLSACGHHRKGSAELYLWHMSSITITYDHARFPVGETLAGTSYTMVL